MTPKLPPLPPADWPPELDEVKADLANPLNVHNMMAHHPELSLAWLNFRNHIVRHSTLTARQRELVILRTAANCRADYEWQHHVIRGQQAGLTTAEIEAVKEGPTAAGWSELERLLLQAADECRHTFSLSEATYTALGDHFSSQQLLDLLATIGMYMTLALILKSFAVPMEDET